MNAMNEAMDAINQLVIFSLRYRLLKIYENHWPSALVDSSDSHPAKFNLTNENDEMDRKNLKNSRSG